MGGTAAHRQGEQLAAAGAAAKASRDGAAAVESLARAPGGCMKTDGDLAGLYAAAWANQATRPVLENLLEVAGFMERSEGRAQ